MFVSCDYAREIVLELRLMANMHAVKAGNIYFVGKDKTPPADMLVSGRSDGFFIWDGEAVGKYDNGEPMYERISFMWAVM